MGPNDLNAFGSGLRAIVKYGRKKRTCQASAITEFAPALILLLLIFLFPLMNLLALALSYTDCLYLDFLLLRQAGLERVLVMGPNGKLQTDYTCSTDPNGSLNKIITAWQNSGLGRFAGTANAPQQTISVDLTEGTQNVKYVHLNLLAEVRPLLAVPFPYPVPGLNATVTFNFSGRSVIEYVPR